MVGVQMKRVKRRKAWLSGLEGNKIWPNRATNKQKSSKSNNNNEKNYYYRWRKGIETERDLLTLLILYGNLMERLKNECFSAKFNFRQYFWEGINVQRHKHSGGPPKPIPSPQ